MVNLNDFKDLIKVDRERSDIYNMLMPDKSKDFRRTQLRCSSTILHHRIGSTNQQFDSG